MCLPYIGGKSRISKSLIIPNIPNDIETYIEPFGGMYWTFFGMNIEMYPNLKTIVYNDFNKLNTNLFRCLKNPNILLEFCQKLPVQIKGESPTNPECVETFYRVQSEIYSVDFNIGLEANYDVASKYAYVLSQIFSGANPSKSKFVDLQGKYHSKFTSFMNKLGDSRWQKLFKSITNVENIDFEEVIKKYDSLRTFIYVDPPYYIVGEGNYYSNHDFTRDDHERLSNCLKSMSGRFSLSYYNFDKLSQWFPNNIYKWIEKDFTKAAGAVKGKSQNKGTEILIMNYEI